MKNEVEEFLRNFKPKMNIWDVLFYDSRSKNIQTLLDLEISRNYRVQVLEELDYRDYSEGPLKDNMLEEADMWVFGKTIKSQEVYIKITMGNPNRSVICISFHLAEYPMNYPLKECK